MPEPPGAVAMMPRLQRTDDTMTTEQKPLRTLEYDADVCMPAAEHRALMIAHRAILRAANAIAKAELRHRYDDPPPTWNRSRQACDVVAYLDNIAEDLRSEAERGEAAGLI